jgi:hypothetical protein
MIHDLNRTIHLRLIMALSDAIIVEQTPVHKHRMEALQKILMERYKPGNRDLETKQP